MSDGAGERQTRKTRGAILGAFGGLALERPYDDIRVADVVGRADVGRSTFYEHFLDKDDLLRQSLGGILAILASAADDECDARRVGCVLDHFRDNLPRVRGMLNGPHAAQVLAALAPHVRGRLTARAEATGRQASIPAEMAAAAVAETLVGLIRAWVAAGAACPAEQVAEAMHRGASALARSFFAAG